MTNVWRLFECGDSADGDPEGEPCGYAVVHSVPDEADYYRASDFDFCPKCGGHASFTGSGEVEVARAGKQARFEIPAPAGVDYSKVVE